MRVLILFLSSFTCLMAQRSAYVSLADPPENPGKTSRSAREIVQQYLDNSSDIPTAGLAGVYLVREFKTAHNGVTHLRYRQRFQGLEVANATWAASISESGEVLSAGGTLYLPPSAEASLAPGSALQAARAAVATVNPGIASRYVPFEITPSARTASDGTRVAFVAGELGSDVEGRLVWFGLRGSLHLAWQYYIVDADHASAYSVAVEADTGAVLDARPMSYFQSAPNGLVFTQGSPQPTVAGVRATEAPKVVERTLIPLRGDSVASPLGWVAGSETAGNNVVTGGNTLGRPFVTPATTKAVDGAFRFPLEVGPTAPSPVTFTDAANTNLFYWVNRAHDLHYQYGFDEASGNFQQSNFGRGGVGGDAILAYSHYAAAAPLAPALRNAFFTSLGDDDGSPAMIAMYAGYSNVAGFFTDSALDADVIVHEYTHGVSRRLVADGYSTFQGRSMGEAWSDFFALEYLTPDGAPVDGVYGSAQYYFQAFGSGLRSRPFSTSLEVNPLTYNELGKVILAGPEVHADGEIWVEALWEARAALIGQFGETEGRRRIRQLVLDGMKLSVPAPSMTDARDAILLADRVGFRGQSQTQLWTAFAKRGLGALAYSPDGDSLHVSTSFEIPASIGKLKFYESTFVAGEPVRVLLSDLNYSQPSAKIQVTSSAGDLEDVTLSREGSIYIGTIPSSVGLAADRQNGTLNVGTFNAISAYYVDLDAGSGPAQLIQTSANIQLPYAAFSTTQTFAFPSERRILSSATPAFFDLPFEFPFFSKKYRRVLVMPTGTLAFEPSAKSNGLARGCQDVVELRRMSAIAPLMHPLTFGAAQAAEGVYVSNPTSNTITFRWAAETLTGFSPNNGDPVNFAVTLSQDGTIQFHYGSGNSNLHTAFSSSACGIGPVSGLSNGHDVYARSIFLRSWTNAPTVRFDPPFHHSSDPVIRIEKPVQSDTTAEVLTVSGVVYDPQSPITLVEIFIDDVLRTVTGPNVSRPDVCAGQSFVGCPFVGFLTNINLTTQNVTPGPHTIWARATNARGGFTSTEDKKIAITTEATGRRPKGAIESPTPGSEVSDGLLFVRGHAYFDDLRIVLVDTIIDGITYPSTSFGLSRTDICGALRPAPPTCPAIGFSGLIDTESGIPPLPDGVHKLQIRVLDETGRYTILNPEPITFTVKNGAQPAPSGTITSPQPGATLSGIVNISGYGYVTRGRVIGAQVVLDGTTLSTAQYGTPAREVCEGLQGISACPNIGFTGTLDTRGFSNGPHVLGVRLFSDFGISVVVPALDRNGMNVTFDNR